MQKQKRKNSQPNFTNEWLQKAIIIALICVFITAIDAWAWGWIFIVMATCNISSCSSWGCTTDQRKSKEDYHQDYDIV